MSWTRALLTAALGCGLAAPVFAQTVPAVAIGNAAPSTATAPVIAQPNLSAPPHGSGEAVPAKDAQCALGDFCVGPLITLGVADPIGVGAHLRYGRYFGFGVDYQFLPTRIDIGTASSAWSLFTVEGRVYPFANAFFLSGGIGYQRFAARVHQMTPSGDVGLSGSLGMPALKIGIGFMGHDGFVLGADIGFNVLLGNPRVNYAAPTGPGASYQTGTLLLRQQVDDIAKQTTSSFPVIPQVNLIRMGYLF